MLRRYALLGLATFSVGFAAIANEPGPAGAAVADALNVEEIIARNAQARGGLDAWKSLTTLTEKGHIEHGQIKGPRSRHGAPAGSQGGALEQALPFTLQIKRPHRMRLEMNLGDTTALQLFDGAEGATIQPSPKGPLVHRFSETEAAAAAEQVDPEGPLLDATAKGTRVDLEGTESVEGRPAYRLRLTLRSGVQRHVWVDARTFLDVKIDGARQIEGRNWPAETYFYDWRKVGGVALPYRIETAIDGARSSTRILVDRVIANAPLDDAPFRLPATLPKAPAAAP